MPFLLLWTYFTLSFSKDFWSFVISLVNCQLAGPTVVFLIFETTIPCGLRGPWHPKEQHHGETMPQRRDGNQIGTLAQKHKIGTGQTQTHQRLLKSRYFDTIYSPSVSLQFIFCLFSQRKTWQRCPWRPQKGSSLLGSPPLRGKGGLHDPKVTAKQKENHFSLENERKIYIYPHRLQELISTFNDLLWIEAAFKGGRPNEGQPGKPATDLAFIF